MYPELLIQIWMSSKSVASTIIGTSMGQEICLILGQVSHNSLYWKKNLQTEICGAGGRLTRKTTDIQARSFMARNLEKLYLENARKLQGIYFIDPEDKEFKNTVKNARKKLETPVASNKIKTRLACILEAGESTRLRMGESLPNHYEDHIAGKGDNSLQHYNLVHKFIPTPQAVKIPAASCAPRWYCKRRFRFLCSVHRTRIISILNNSHKSHGHFFMASRMFRISSWCSIRLYPGKNGTRSQIIKIPNRNVQIFGYVYHDTNGPNHGPVWKIRCSSRKEGVQSARILCELQRYVRIQDFCWSQRKTADQSFRETWCRNNIFLVLWHGRSRKEMCGKILRICK